MYLHIGEEIDGVDMRAEVGLLTRNIVIMGEMEDRCYPYTNHTCSFFDFDTFGGHIKVGVCLAKAPSPPGEFLRCQPRNRRGGTANLGTSPRPSHCTPSLPPSQPSTPLKAVMPLPSLL